MAHLYGGDLNKIDDEVMRAVERLPDDFWVFAEFNIDRNIDWLIIREVPASQKALRSSTMIMTELKRESRPLRGLNMNGPWEKLNEAGYWEEIHTSGREFNYYQQALKTSDALQNWLWTNQRLYLEGSGTFLRPRDDFKAWPDLLVISPPTTTHQLPIRPPTGYGGFWFELDKWLNHVQTWNPRSGCALSAGEITKLAEVLGLKALNNPVAAPTAAEAALHANQPGELGGFVAYLLRLEERVRVLEQKLQIAGSPAGGNGGQPAGQPENFNGAAGLSGSRFTSAPAAEPPPVARPLTDEERDAIEDAVDTLRRTGRTRAVPQVLDEVNTRLGYNLRERNFNGFVSGRNLLEQARTEGLIKFGPNRGLNTNVYLPYEDVPRW